MHEQVLRNFLAGELGAAALAADLAGAVVRTGPHSSAQRITDMAHDFEVEPEHLVRLCDAVLSGAVPPPELATVGFCLIASDHFFWDGETERGARVAEAVYDWAAPEVNYRLTLETVAKFRHRLLTGHSLFTQADITGASV